MYCTSIKLFYVTQHLFCIDTPYICTTVYIFLYCSLRETGCICNTCKKKISRHICGKKELISLYNGNLIFSMIIVFCWWQGVVYIWGFLTHLCHWLYVSVMQYKRYELYMGFLIIYVSKVSNYLQITSAIMNRRWSMCEVPWASRCLTCCPHRPNRKFW